MQSQYSEEVFVIPPPPADAGLSPPLPPCEQGANLHLNVLPHSAKSATRMAYPEVVHPPGKYGIDLPHQVLRGVAPPRRMVSRILALIATQAFFFGVMRMK